MPPQTKFDSSSFDFHRKNPNVSLASYARHKQIELGTAVSSFKKIYLDLRFWILFRDVELGIRHDQVISNLLSHIQLLVAQGKVICPISESVFIELLKQGDISTRVATAKLIDELSKGITLVPFNERVCQELCNSFYIHAGATDLIPTNQLVWTKLAYVLGQAHPSNTFFSPEEELVIQKAFLDHMWRVSLEEMVGHLNDQPLLEQDWNSIATSLNKQNKAHRSDLKSYSHTFRIEFEGALNLFHKEINLLLSELAQRGFNAVDKKVGNLSTNKRFESFSLSVPTLHIYSTCHAAVRWDQQRNLEGNDFFDFHHAEVALGYCDVFLTEKGLCVLLNQNHLKLTKNYQCKIFWSAKEALSWLRESYY